MQNNPIHHFFSQYLNFYIFQKTCGLFGITSWIKSTDPGAIDFVSADAKAAI
jgi:hypothetical protein